MNLVTQKKSYADNYEHLWLFHWRVLAASVRGKSHEKVGQLCQDAHHWEKLPEGVLVAAVADGAGSATLGKVGLSLPTQTAVKQYA